MSLFLLNYTISHLLVGVILVPLAVFVYLRNPKGMVNRTFSVYSLAISWWSLLSIPLIHSRDIASARIWDQVCLICVILTPPTFLHFTHAFLRFMDQKKYRMVTWAAYLLSSVFLISDATPLFVRELSQRGDVLFFTDPGLFYYLFLFYFFVTVCYGIFLLGKAVSEKTDGPLFQKQKLYLFYSTLLGYTGASTNYLIVFNIKPFELAPFGNYLITLYCATVAYAIVRYHLLDIRIFALRGFLLGISYALGFGIPLGFGWYLRHQNPEALLSWWWLMILGTGFMTGISPFIYVMLRTITERKRDQERFERFEALHKASQEIIRHKKRDTLSRAVVLSVKKILNLEHAALYLRIENDYILMSGYKPGEEHWKETLPGRWGHETALVKRLMGLLENSETEFFLEKERIEKWEGALQEIEQLKVQIVVPIGTERRLYGFLCLGPTTQGRVLEKEELEQLRFLADQVVLAVENIEAMDRLEQYQQYEAEQKRVASIGKLNAVLMHLVNNPLMMVCGFAQQLMMKLKKEGAVEETLQKLNVVNEKGLQASEVLRAVMEYVRRTTEQQMGIVLLKPLIQEVVEGLKKQPESEKIKVKMDFRSEGEVLADVGQIQQVVRALLRRQWEWLQGEGEIQIVLSAENHEIVLTIANPRTLLEEKERLELFDQPKYITGQAKEKGTGLEMYLGRMIVAAHRGEIGSESEPGKGTRFWIRFPEYTGKKQKGMWRSPR
ncbi:MAG: GAF domain-containing protein [Candidatus Omnitrophica bacterium]|nr:GAF domain-containing protein [Candidatus Omnitrophota bacterium]